MLREEKILITSHFFIRNYSIHKENILLAKRAVFLDNNTIPSVGPISEKDPGFVQFIRLLQIHEWATDSF